MTKKIIDIKNICHDCGFRYGLLKPAVVLAHAALCDVCGKWSITADRREFGIYRMAEEKIRQIRATIGGKKRLSKKTLDNKKRKGV